MEASRHHDGSTEGVLERVHGKKFCLRSELNTRPGHVTSHFFLFNS